MPGLFRKCAKEAPGGLFTALTLLRQNRQTPVQMKVVAHLPNMLITDIEDDYPSPKDISDFYFPVAQVDITKCSTYAVVCRLKSSPPYTITSTGGLFSHPDFPGVAITIPENAVAPSEFPLKLKVGVITY